MVAKGWWQKPWSSDVVRCSHVLLDVPPAQACGTILIGAALEIGSFGGFLVGSLLLV